MLTQQTVDDVIDWASDEDVETPALLLAPGVVHRSVARLRAELGGKVSFAVKANAHPRFLRELAGSVDEFNVTNLTHLRRLLDLGVRPSRIALAHPVLTPRAARGAVECGISRFVLDDLRGLDVLTGLGTPCRVTLRLLPPDRGQSTHSLIRFGNTDDALVELATKVAGAGMEIEALSFFVGTAGEGMAEAVPFRKGIEALARLHEQLDRDGITVPTINIGGGFPGAQRRFHQRNPDFFRQIADAVTTFFGPGTATLCEPGRFLSEPSMAVLTRVIADRRVAGNRMVHLDAGAFADLFESCFIQHGSADLTVQAHGPATGTAPAAVLGPIMDSFDVVSRSADLPSLTEGQPLLIPNVGAYNVDYSVGCEGQRAPAVVELPKRLIDGFADAWFA